MGQWSVTWSKWNGVERVTETKILKSCVHLPSLCRGEENQPRLGKGFPHWALHVIKTQTGQRVAMKQAMILGAPPFGKRTQTLADEKGQQKKSINNELISLLAT